MRQRCILLKYGELAIKGRNKGRFERRLLANLHRRLAGFEYPVHVDRREGLLVVSAPAGHDELLARVRDVVGISVVQPAIRAAKTPEAAAEAALELVRELRPSAEPAPFAVRARRRNKNFPLDSQQLAAHVGAHIQRQLGWPVDLETPGVEVAVEVDRSEVFVAVERHQGQGGLPVGVSGTALVMLSGGYDSPVAAYRAMRRGLRCEFVHFSGAPLTGPASVYKAYALVRQLDRFQGGSRVHVVMIGEAQRALAAAGAGELQIVAQRRLMVRIADALAGRLGADALVTGDSLGQVSSQTLPNLAAVEQTATRPVLRPLVGWDKEEIMAESRRIGTAEVSELPDEDCCTLLVPPRVTTRAEVGSLDRVERRLGIDEVVERALAKVQVLTIDDSDEQGTGTTGQAAAAAGTAAEASGARAVAPA